MEYLKGHKKVGCHDEGDMSFDIIIEKWTGRLVEGDKREFSLELL